eukprot:6559-Heterococcus_DN1.PRE.2
MKNCPSTDSAMLGCSMLAGGAATVSPGNGRAALSPANCSGCAEGQCPAAQCYTVWTERSNWRVHPAWPAVCAVWSAERSSNTHSSSESRGVLDSKSACV